MKKDQAYSHVYWIDYLRILACLMVVLNHACDEFPDPGYEPYKSLIFIRCMIRPCVPLFVMVTGMLLSENDKLIINMGNFYKCRIRRILLPLIFWSIMFPFIINFFLEIISTFRLDKSFNWAIFSRPELWTQTWSWVFNFNGYTYMYWYLYMLIGLYFVMPIINTWLKYASKKDIKWILILWFISLCLPYIRVIVSKLNSDLNNGLLLGEATWNIFGMFYYVSGFLGYYIIAFYLRKYPLDLTSPGKKMAVLTFYICGLLITLIPGFWFFANGANRYFDILLNYCNINVAIMTISIYLLFKGLNFKRIKLFVKLSSLTFGIYLTHFPFVILFSSIFSIIHLAPIYFVPLVGVTSFVTSGLLVWFLKCFKITSRLVT